MIQFEDLFKPKKEQLGSQSVVFLEFRRLDRLRFVDVFSTNFPAMVALTENTQSVSCGCELVGSCEIQTDSFLRGFRVSR